MATAVAALDGGILVFSLEGPMTLDGLKAAGAENAETWPARLTQPSRLYTRVSPNSCPKAAGPRIQWRVDQSPH